MATIREIIERVDELRPNAFTEKMKLAWLSELEGKIAADVMLMNIDEICTLELKYPDSMDTEPMVRYPHQDIYVYWLQAQIDYANGEYNKYQNSMEMYNQHYGNFVRWFANTYEPAHGYPDKPWPDGWEDPPYYLTPYGQAVKNGFQGSLEDWLSSLVGPEGPPGKTAYAHAVALGFEGTEEEWMESLEGKSAYEVALKNGFVGTEAEWLDHLKRFYTVLFPSQTVDFRYLDSASVDVDFSFEAGQDYLVTIDGKQYLRKCEWAFGEEGVYNEAYVGNKHFMNPSIFPDNGDPFYVTVIDGTMRIIVDDPEESYTIEIRKAFDIVVDSDLSETSENPVQNKAIAGYLRAFVDMVNGNIMPRLAPMVTAKDDGKVLTAKNGIWVASDSFSNEVIDQMQKDIADLKYVPIDISTMSGSPMQVEKGSVVSEVAIHWRLNKEPASQTINGEEVAVSERAKTVTGPFSEDTTFTLEVTDERGATKNRSVGLSFENGVYYGVLNDGAEVDSAAVLTLNCTLRATKTANFTVSAGATQRIAYAIPTQYGTPTFNVGGFDGGFALAKTMDFTNASGYTESYDVWLSENVGLGETTVKVT